MLSLSSATEEANARSAVYEEELRRIDTIANGFEEQVFCLFIGQFVVTSVISDTS